jgi:hypothetical protein
MHEMKQGKLKTGSGKKVTNRKQAIAIGLFEARKEGAKIPAKEDEFPKNPKKNPLPKNRQGIFYIILHMTMRYSVLPHHSQSLLIPL